MSNFYKAVCVAAFAVSLFQVPLANGATTKWYKKSQLRSVSASLEKKGIIPTNMRCKHSGSRQTFNEVEFRFTTTKKSNTKASTFFVEINPDGKVKKKITTKGASYVSFQRLPRSKSGLVFSCALVHFK